MSGVCTQPTGSTAVHIGKAAVGADGHVLFIVGLGSCVAVALYDPEARVAGLAHVMLPTPADARPGGSPGRFASTAVPLLIATMRTAGAEPARLRAKIAGGAAMFGRVLPDTGRSLGQRNVHSVRAALAAAGIELYGQEVGGDHGRSVYFDSADGALTITSVRHGDVIL
jgi:chemotaxis protein CheD